VTWADPDAVQVQTDIADVIKARTPQARNQATASLHGALRVLDAQRAAVDTVMEHAITSTSAHATPPRLPG
jgi:tRNA U34 5-carboxymethylaminomethyl modifying GTPase MnmE/TrmE